MTNMVSQFSRNRCDSYSTLLESLPEDKKTETKSFAKKSWNHFQEFSNSTTIHGVKYLGEKNRPFYERILWLLMLSVCIFFLSRFIMDIYKKWEQTPTIINRNNRPTSISEIPYPSITVCPYSRISAKVLEKLKIDKSFRNGLYYHLCDKIPRNVSNHLNDDGSNIIHNIKSVATDVSDLFASCTWNQEPDLSCAQLFKPVLTDDGICYTFNYVTETSKYPEENDKSQIYFDIPAHDWTFQKGYVTKYNLISSYPRRPWLYGKHNRFEFILNSQLDDQVHNMDCKPLDNGYKIFLNSPGIYPHTGVLNSDVIIINHQNQIDIEIEPNQIQTSDDLRSYSIENRQCYFENERKLKLFNIYNQFNCKLECLTNMTYQQCGCVKYSMVHTPEQAVCGVHNISCYTNVVDNELNLTSHIVDKKMDCYCLPECNSIKYDTKVMQRNFDLRKMEMHLNITEEGENVERTMVNVYFRSREFIGYSRNELYGVSDFVSNIGGLLGLFMGTSIVSLIDVCYFGSVRIYSNYYYNTK